MCLRQPALRLYSAEKQLCCCPHSCVSYPQHDTNARKGQHHYLGGFKAQHALADKAIKRSSQSERRQQAGGVDCGFPKPLFRFDKSKAQEAVDLGLNQGELRREQRGKKPVEAAAENIVASRVCDKIHRNGRDSHRKHDSVHDSHRDF